ncbi:Tda2 protein [Saccharomycopsis crataegensis]|uniref:Topoisomerase I damage affected protein 2 n=1 Tax=Saccharomycopsis crataegensis TaxID=43959 RepID=A0AAV5QHQ5_9ASCO|nr:Tda2 protein [Saccharomycopsis crataegensis]
MTMTTKILSASCNEESSPIIRSKLDKLVEQEVSLVATKGSNSTRSLIESILQALKKTSSLHKFIVNVSAITYSTSETELSIKSSIGSVWESKKDGYINYKISDNDTTEYLISIIWIHIDG